MKKIITLLVSFILVFSLFTACDTEETVKPAESKIEITNETTQSETVYRTKTGKKYHESDCIYLKNSKIEITLSKAKSKGLTPCSVCRPPEI